MIKIFYGPYSTEFFRVAIKQADSDIRYHKEVGEIRRLCSSEHYILRICQAVRCGILRTDEVEIWVDDEKIELDVKGEFITPWPDDLFEADFYIRFSPYPVYQSMHEGD